MKDSLLLHAAHEVAEDPKIIRIATITSFIHSILSFLYLMYIASNFVSSFNNTDDTFLPVVQEYINLISFNSASVITLIILGLVLLIGYTLLPPVGDAGIISYLHGQKKSTTTAIATGMTHFLQMFEYNAAVSLFSMTTIMVITSRLYTMGVLETGVGIAIVIMMMLMMIIVDVFLPYTKQIITIEGLSFFDAMQKSGSLAMHNMSITMRYVMISLFMHIRIIINILILIGIPALLLYFGGVLGIESNEGTKIVFLIVIIALLSFVSYINAIIEAFFQTYRYKVYMIITNPNHETLQATAQMQMQATLFST